MSSRLARVGNLDDIAKQARYNLHEFADLCHVSVRQLERFFKHSLAQTPRAWIANLRIQEAKRLLSGGLSVKEIAYSVGFKHPSHFCRAFKQWTGSSPGGYFPSNEHQANGIPFVHRALAAKHQGNQQIIAVSTPVASKPRKGVIQLRRRKS